MGEQTKEGSLPQPFILIDRPGLAPQVKQPAPGAEVEMLREAREAYPDARLTVLHYQAGHPTPLWPTSEREALLVADAAAPRERFDPYQPWWRTETVRRTILPPTEPATPQQAATVSWSAEDGCYVARLLDQPAIMAHGPTREQALAELEVARELSDDAGDPLHPTGRCTCFGEGRCAWCRSVAALEGDEA